MDRTPRSPPAPRWPAGARTPAAGGPAATGCGAAARPRRSASDPTTGPSTGRPPPSRTDQAGRGRRRTARSEEHTSELQSRQYLVCRLLLEKKKKKMKGKNKQQGKNM